MEGRDVRAGVSLSLREPGPLPRRGPQVILWRETERVSLSGSRPPTSDLPDAQREMIPSLIPPTADPSTALRQRRAPPPTGATPSRPCFP